MMEERSGTNCGLEVKFWGVAGREVVVPMASWAVGGVVGRSERSDLLGSIGSLWTNCECVQCEKIG